jgi:GntR family transcriptional repressor for pyruvate dehydrogenase complex
MTSNFQPVTAGVRLSDQVAQQIATEIKSGRLAPGDRLPPEVALGAQFAVSRTVVREAVSRLKSLGLVESRQGSGAFVSPNPPFEPLNFAAAQVDSRTAVAQMVEVRRGLEAEAAALAAQRRTAAELRRIEHAVTLLDKAVVVGGDGVEEDLAFHRSISHAAHNPFLMATLDFLAQYMRGAIKVTRANEARRADFTGQVRDEHAAIVAAVRAGDAVAARLAAGHHMAHAIVRIESADPAFWAQEGARLARPLLRSLPRR